MNRRGSTGRGSKSRHAAGLAVLAGVLLAPGARSTEPYRFEHGYPVGDTIARAYDESDLRRAIEAYKFFFPTLSTEALMQQAERHRPASSPANAWGIKLKHGPRHQIPTGNDVTPYAWGMLDLRASGPLVIELPPGKLMGFVVDHNMRWVTDLGLIGPDKGKGGKHLVLPPHWQGEVPESGYFVHRSPTWRILPFLRAMADDGATASALAMFDAVAIHPLAGASGATPYRFVNVTAEPLPLPLLAWEQTLDYWRELHAVIDAETAPPELRPMLGMLAQLGIAKGRAFAPDERMQAILEHAARTALAEMRVNAYDNRRTDRAVWADRNWQWIPVRLLSAETHDYGTGDFLDLEGTDNIVFQGWGATPAAGARVPGAGSLYYGSYFDHEGRHLDGGKRYRLRIPAPVPATLFWSNTVYDVDTRSLIATEQDKGSINSLADPPAPAADGTIELLFGPEPPPGGTRNWIRTMPGKGWFAYFRIFGPLAPVFDGSWKLGDIEPLP